MYFVLYCTNTPRFAAEAYYTDEECPLDTTGTKEGLYHENVVARDQLRFFSFRLNDALVH